MLFKKIAALLSLICLLPASAAWSEVRIYQCQIEERGNMGWIPSVVIVAHNENTDEVFVSDPVGYHFNDKRPLSGTIAVKNKKRITFRWAIKKMDAGRGQFVSDFVYRGTFIYAQKKMTVTGQPLGYANKFYGKGPCKVTTK